MTTDVFHSSDSVRSARPLRHARSVTFEEPLHLELGGQLPEVTVVYETYGQLSETGDNAILICHALSGDSHVARHDPHDDPGWWDIAVGPGKAIDTDRYFVICPNVLGGCRGTTGPNERNPLTGKRYGAEFPTITAADMVEAQRRLVDHLGITRLLAAIGGSMGGHQVLTWAIRYPERLAGAVLLASCARLTTQALAFDIVGRNAIRRDANYKGGRYLDKGTVPAAGLAIARMLGHITYLSPESMREKFEADRLQPREIETEFEKMFSVGSYLAYQGDKFVERFDANSYITLSLAMDLFDVGRNVEELSKNLARSQSRWLIISFSSDWLFPPEQSQQITDALIALGKPVSYCNVRSKCGHDAFLLPDDLQVYGEMVRAFLNNVHGGEPFVMDEEDHGEQTPTSIFGTLRSPRLDYEHIVSIIEPEASVLDLGCGKGTLLSRLRQKGNPRLSGIEIDQENVLFCLQRGLDVVQADLNEGLNSYPDAHFDYVVLSQTLQAVRDVERLIRDMLRVGRKSIVSFPNFAYYKLRTMLAKEGKSPVSSGLLRHAWYNTPNIRFLSISDFEQFCAERGIRIHERIALDSEEGRTIHEDANLMADMAIFVLSNRG